MERASNESRKDRPKSAPGSPFQFSLTTLLEVTFGIALVIGLVRSGPLGIMALLVGAALWFILYSVSTLLYLSRDWPSNAGRLVVVATVVVVQLGLFCTCVLPSPTFPYHQRFRHRTCGNNLRHIEMALSEYHASFGAYPPPVVFGPDGRPWHSWRALLLSRLDADLHRRYRLDEPWDGPNNRALLDIDVPAFRCPHCSEPPGACSYYYVTGPGRVEASDSRGFAPRDMKDGISNTILVVESKQVGAKVLEPRDLPIEQLLGAEVDTRESRIARRSASHTWESEWGIMEYDGFFAAMGDGRVIWIDGGVSREALKALLTFDGGDQLLPVQNMHGIESDGESRWRPKYGLWVLLGAELVFIALVLYRHRPPGWPGGRPRGESRPSQGQGSQHTLADGESARALGEDVP